MTAQLYETKRNNFLTTLIPQEPPYSFDFYLGEFSSWTALKNSSNEFISLGGDRDNPLIYKYQNTGITDFTFSIIAPNTPRVIDVYNSIAWYELWIDGIKPYYFYFGSQSEMIFTRTVSVVANKDQTTKFKFRLTLFFASPTPDLKKYYFEGDPDIVYSSITAKFIPDSTSNEPVLLTKDSTLSMNRRYIVKAPFGTTVQLKIDDSNIQIGNWIEIKNIDAGGFQINNGDKIDIIMNGHITTAKSGYIQGKKPGDFIRLECMQISPRIVFSDTANIGITTIVF